MIYGYHSEIMKQYEAIREDERLALQKRKEELEKNHPEIMDLDRKIAKLSIELSLSFIKHKDKVEERVTELRNKITDLRAHKYELLVASGYDTQYLNLHYRCPKCQDTGYIGVEKCHCYKEKQISLYYRNSELQECIKTDNFNNFRLDYYETHRIGEEKYSPRKNMELILEKIQGEYLPNFHNHSDNIMFYGNSGTGKTFLSHCIAKELLDKGNLVVYRTSEDLMKNLKDIRFNNNKDLENLLINCDLLIIDDLGAELLNDYIVTELFNFLNEKLLKRKKMLISTNLTLGQLSKCYTERLSSRLYGNFSIFKFYSEDIRVKKNLSKMNR
ncbi:ATP-binding protein [Alloiococcus sp. CFN-8]|uniref:ATP-binding protein n=1 Tax=Alloiococcus sp. CFN-8 TaxID=3416081 RepID=UPI003CECFDAB